MFRQDWEISTTNNRKVIRKVRSLIKKVFIYEPVAECSDATTAQLVVAAPKLLAALAACRQQISLSNIGHGRGDEGVVTEAIERLLLDADPTVFDEEVLADE